MSDEKDILLDIYKCSNHFLIELCKFNIHLKQIESDIQKLDNNYFEKNNLFPQLLHCYDDIVIQELLSYKNMIESKLNNVCIHEWIIDYIDNNLETSQQICYCKLCEITKK